MKTGHWRGKLSMRTDSLLSRRKPNKNSSECLKISSNNTAPGFQLFHLLFLSIYLCLFVGLFYFFISGFLLGCYSCFMLIRLISCFSDFFCCGLNWVNFGFWTLCWVGGVFIFIFCMYMHICVCGFYLVQYYAYKIDIVFFMISFIVV